MNATKILTGLIIGMVLLACNHPAKSRKQQPAHAKSLDDEKNIKRDTTYGGYHIAVVTHGNDNIRNLLLYVGSVKDTIFTDSIIDRDVKGMMEDMMIADLDGDGKPEVYFSMLSEGTGHYGKIYGYDLAGKIARINTDAIDTMQLPAYRGQDSFYIKGNKLVRTFPAYKEDDPNGLAATPKGMLLYHLKREGDTLMLIQDVGVGF